MFAHSEKYRLKLISSGKSLIHRRFIVEYKYRFISNRVYLCRTLRVVCWIFIYLRTYFPVGLHHITQVVVNKMHSAFRMQDLI